MLLDRCRIPVVLAPLAGGPSTPELCAAVSDAVARGSLPPDTSQPPSSRRASTGPGV